MDVSFIVPAYKSEKTLHRCLKGILAQNYPGRYEIILVICCGSKAELAALKEFEDISHVRIICTTIRNRSYSRNLGAQASTGNFLAFVDSDVLIEPNWLINNLYPFKNKLVAASQGSFCLENNANAYDKMYGFIPVIDQCINALYGPVVVTGACIY